MSQRRFKTNEYSTYRMNPEECASTSSLRARRHPLRYLEIGESIPDAGMIHAEHCKVLRLNAVDVRLVGDGQGTSFDIIYPGRVDSRGIGVWASVISLLCVATIAALPVRRRCFAARYFRSGCFACWKFEKVFWMRWIVKMAVKPPLIERVVH